MSDASSATSTLDVDRIDPTDAEQRTPIYLQGGRQSGFQVVFARSALDAIHEHGKSRTDVEICGVLVGRLCRDRFGPYLLVSDIVRGAEANQRAAQVTFTAETWELIHREMEQRFTTEKIVGWYHTHPGFGIFLSGMDLFIQDHFFNLPWQVAFVYDPLGGDEGVFVWRRGKSIREPHLVEQRDGGTDWKKLIKRPPPEPTATSRIAPWVQTSMHAVPWLALACFLLSFTAAWVFLTFLRPEADSPTTQPALQPGSRPALEPAMPSNAQPTMRSNVPSTMQSSAPSNRQAQARLTTQMPAQVVDQPTARTLTRSIAPPSTAPTP